MAARRCPNCDCIAGPLTRFSGRSRLCEYCKASLARRGLAWCGGCQQPRPHVLRSRCGDCRAVWRKAYYAANTEREKAGARARYQADPQRVRARRAAWRRANPERERAIRRRASAAYRARHAERLRPLKNERNRAYHQRNRARILAAMRERRIRHLLRILRGA